MKSMKQRKARAWNLRLAGYYEIETTGSRIGLAVCLDCGSSIILGADQAPQIHGQWHAANAPRPKRKKERKA